MDEVADGGRARRSALAAGGGPASRPDRPATLALITATVFGFVTSITMIGPLLVDLGRDFGVSVGTAGLLATAMALPWAAGAPFVGVLSDRLGRRPLIVLALAGVGGCSLAAAAAPSFAVVLVLRFAAGVFGTFGPTALMAAIGDLFPLHRRAMAMSWYNMGFGLAAVGGVPATALVAGWLGWRAAFAVTGAGLLGIAGLVRLGFPAPPVAAPAGGIADSYRRLLRVRRLPHLLLGNLLERIGFFATTLYVPSFLILAYGLDPAAIALPLALIAVGAIGGNLLGGWLGDRAPQHLVFALGQLTAGAIGVLLFGVPAGLALSAAAGVAFGLANAAGRPGLLATGSEMLPQQRGAVLGLVGVTNQGGLVLGSALGAAALDLGGYGTLAGLVAAAAALAAGFGLALGGVRPAR